MDMTTKTDQQIQDLIDNHRRVGKLDAPLAVSAIEEFYHAERQRAFGWASTE